MTTDDLAQGHRPTRSHECRRGGRAEETSSRLMVVDRGTSRDTATGARRVRSTQSARPVATPVRIRWRTRKQALIQIILVAMLVSTGTKAAPADQGSAAVAVETPQQVFASALRQSIGAPARADLQHGATVRLADGLLLVPTRPAANLLSVLDQPVPPDFAGLLLGPDGLEAAGKIRFIPAGFIDSDAALAWTADDMLSSLRATVERRNPDRAKADLPELEARRWVQPPRYDPESHRLSWAALIVPKTAPLGTDGEVTYQGVGFGRAGYIQLTVVSSVEKADQIEHMIDRFLSGLNFTPGNAYIDFLATDRKAPDGLAGALGVDSLQKSESGLVSFSSDLVVPGVGAAVASIGALSLLFSVQRHRRRESRRV
jgi:uncharacterized membrane-anchored protein